MFGGCARESQRWRGAWGESERPGGVHGVADGIQGNERKQEVARGEAGGGRGSVGERHASPLLVLLAEEEGGSRRWLGGKQEVAEAASASATPRLCSSSWQRRKRTKEEEVGWAGWGNWAGSGGCAGKAR